MRRANHVPTMESGADRVSGMGHWIMTGSPSLFESHLPQGFHYRENFITEVE